jgi:hypothetical protein
VCVLRQLITEACIAAEFASGVMVRAPWAALVKRQTLKESVSRAQSLPRPQRGVPVEILLRELGLMSFDARASMHTLRIWDAIMAGPAAALPRLAWLVTMAPRRSSNHPVEESDSEHNVTSRT